MSASETLSSPPSPLLGAVDPCDGAVDPCDGAVDTCDGDGATVAPPFDGSILTEET